MSRYHSLEPHQQRTSVPRTRVDTGYAISDDDSTYTTRLPNSTRRYQPQHAVVKQQPKSIIKYEGVYSADELLFLKRRTTAQTTAPQRTQKHRSHWLTYIGVALLFMVTGWICLSFLSSWWGSFQNDLRYGRPRTFHIDAVVGHNDSANKPTHFIAMNLNSQVEVIECPAGDCSKAKIYIGPTLIGQGQELAPVTLSFTDLTSDTKLDMVVHVTNSQVIYINDSGAFRPLKPDEQTTGGKKP